MRETPASAERTESPAPAARGWGWVPVRTAAGVLGALLLNAALAGGLAVGAVLFAMEMLLSGAAGDLAYGRRLFAWGATGLAACVLGGAAAAKGLAAVKRERWTWALDVLALACAAVAAVAFRGR